MAVALIGVLGVTSLISCHATADGGDPPSLQVGDCLTPLPLAPTMFSPSSVHVVTCTSPDAQYKIVPTIPGSRQCNSNNSLVMPAGDGPPQTYCLEDLNDTPTPTPTPSNYEPPPEQRETGSPWPG
jgi:hypothetical protein